MSYYPQHPPPNLALSPLQQRQTMMTNLASLPPPTADCCTIGDGRVDFPDLSTALRRQQHRLLLLQRQAVTSIGPSNCWNDIGQVLDTKPSPSLPGNHASRNLGTKQFLIQIKVLLKLLLRQQQQQQQEQSISAKSPSNSNGRGSGCTTMG